MDSDNREKRRSRSLWLQAGSALARDPTARVACPTCGRGVLVVTDAPVMDGSRIERWMRCDTCGSANTMLMTPEQAAGASRVQPPREQAPGGEFDWTDSTAVENLVVEAVKSIRKKE